MVIKSIVFKIFLICSNVVLLCSGLAILILGIKMFLTLSMLTLMTIPFLQNAINSVMATGVFISMCSLSGLIGASSESKGLILGHLIFLGIIVILEFSIGVTLMMIKQSVSAAVESVECNNVCAATFDAAILHYALPSAGLMMSIIFVEALMIYSSMRLYFFIRDGPGTSTPTELPTVAQNVQRQNVAGTQVAYVRSPQTIYSPQTENTTPQSHASHAYEEASAFRRSHHLDLEAKPPDYNSLNFPPLYNNNEMHYDTAGTSATELLTEDADDFNQV